MPSPTHIPCMIPTMLGLKLLDIPAPKLTANRVRGVNSSVVACLILYVGFFVVSSIP